MHKIYIQCNRGGKCNAQIALSSTWRQCACTSWGKKAQPGNIHHSSDRHWQNDSFLELVQIWVELFEWVFQLCTSIFDINASVVFSKSHTDWPGAFPMWHTAFKHDLCNHLSIYPMLCRYIITLQALFQYKVLILPTLGKTTKPSDRMLIIDPIQKWEQPKFSESGRVSGGTLP